MSGKKRLALVTGASSGIGRATALALAAAGFEVVGTSRDASRAKSAVGVPFVDLDVTSDDSVADTISAIQKSHGQIDVLVNNAGVGSAGAAEESSVVQAQQLFDTNVFGVIRLTNAVLPGMRAQGSGRIINLSSIVGIMPQPYMAVYSASKFAIEGYSESLDHEVREFGVRVSVVEPAWTSTPFDANSVRPDRPLPAYESRRQVFEKYMADAVRQGDSPESVAKVIVAAVTAATPKVRYAGSSRTAAVSTMRRLIPARVFDRQLRRLNKLPL